MERNASNVENAGRHSHIRTNIVHAIESQQNLRHCLFKETISCVLVSFEVTYNVCSL